MSFCSELNAKLDQIITLLESKSACCDGGTSIPAPDYSLDETGDVPQPVIDAGWATGVSDWAGYREYKCMAANAMLDGIIAAIYAFDEPITDGFALYEVFLEILQWAGIGGGLLTMGPVTVSVFALFQLLTAAKDPLLEEMEGLAEDVELNRDVLTCAMYNADGINAIANAFKAAVDDIWTGVTATFLKNLNIDYMAETYFLGAYGDADAAQALADAGYDPGDYDCLGCASTLITELVCDRETAGGTPVDFSWGDVLDAGIDYEIDCELSSYSGNPYVCHVELRVGSCPGSNLGDGNGYRFRINSISGSWTKEGASSALYVFRDSTAAQETEQANVPTLPYITQTIDAGYVAGFKVYSDANPGRVNFTILPT